MFFSLLLGGLYGMITFIEIKFLVHEHKPNYWGAHSIAFRTDTFHAVRKYSVVSFFVTNNLFVYRLETNSAQFEYDQLQSQR